MDYFSIVSQQVAEQFFVSDKEKNHWITNGLKTYLEIQYLKKIILTIQNSWSTF